jgi:hypothetical protein
VRMGAIDYDWSRACAAPKASTRSRPLSAKSTITKIVTPGATKIKPFRERLCHSLATHSCVVSSSASQNLQTQPEDSAHRRSRTHDPGKHGSHDRSVETQEAMRTAGRRGLMATRNGFSHSHIISPAPQRPAQLNVPGARLPSRRSRDRRSDRHRRNEAKSIEPATRT